MYEYPLTANNSSRKPSLSCISRFEYATGNRISAYIAKSIGYWKKILFLCLYFIKNIADMIIKKIMPSNRINVNRPAIAKEM